MDSASNSNSQSEYPIGIPDCPDFPGIQFVLDTSDPPSLTEHVYSNTIISYREHNQSSVSFIQRIITTSPFYLTSFRTYPGSQSTTTISRQELSRAWVIGLNAMRFHAKLYRYLTEYSEEYVINKDSEFAKKLFKVGSEWTGCFKELDWSLGVIKQYEINRYLPKSWLPPYQYDIHDLLKTSTSPHLQFSPRFQPISDIFIHAAHHLLDLDKAGYDPDFLVQVNTTCFDINLLLHCYIPNIGLPVPEFLRSPVQETVMS